MGKKFLAVLFVLISLACPLSAGIIEEGFENGLIAPSWKIEGKAEVSSTLAHSGSKALVVAEKSVLSFDFSKTNTFGKMTCWVYDNKLKADWQKDGFVSGPYWGIKNVKGEVFMLGVTFRDHTTGDKLYNWMSSTELGGENYIWFMDVKRTEGWHKWEINYLDDKDSLKVVKDDKESPSDWTFSRYKTGWKGGFNGIVIRGNKQLSGEIKEPFYFDDIKIEYK